MTELTTVPVAPAVAPGVSRTVGTVVDAELAAVKARLDLIEADAKTDWADVKAWFKAQWPHFVTWGGTALVAAKAFALHL